jgi:predicted ATPase/transcriptional regulator with XRE-family HTH domain
MGIDNPETFGQWLKQRRMLLGFTQAELANALNCSTITIRKIEADERKPSKQVAYLLADFLRIADQDRELFISFSRSEPGLSRVEPLVARFSQAGMPSGVLAKNNLPFPRIVDALPPLPAPRTSFIGREQEQSRLHHLLSEQDARLVTITGAPGVGKTRLVLEVGARLSKVFTEGVCFIPLAHIRSPNDVGWAIAQGLGGTGGNDTNHLDNLVAILRNRFCLLILDNFEHVLEAAPLVTELLKACPQLKVLATSREPLHLYGEHEIHVSPLPLPDYKNLAFSSGDPTSALLQFPSVRLFIQRCQSILPDFQLTPANAEAVANICFRLDGLPLAIELAAARSKIYAPESILLQLKDKFQFLSKGMRDFETRHKTLNAAIDWSYQLLAPQEKQLFERLSIFSGFFTIDDVRTVCFFAETPVEHLDEDVLISLVEKSLIQSSEGGKRFFLLETIREFALNQMETHGNFTILQAAHAHHFLGLAKQASSHLHQPEAALWLDRLDENYVNIRAALSYAFGRGPFHDSLEVAASLLFYWFRRSTFSEGYLWLDTAVKHLDACENLALRANVLTSFGAIGYFLRVGAPFEDRLNEALALWRKLGDLHGEAVALFWLSLVSHESSYLYLDESIALFRQAGDPWWLAFSLWLQAAFTVSGGGRPVAIASLEESERLFLRLEDPYGLSYTHAAFGRAKMHSGDLHAARRHLEKALVLKQSFGDKWGIAQVVKDMGEVVLLTATEPKDYQHARILLEESITRFRELNTQHIEIVHTMHLLGHVLAGQNDFSQAQKLYQETLLLGKAYQIGAKAMATYLVGPAHLAFLSGKPFLAAQLISAIYTYDPQYPRPIDCAGKIMMQDLRSAVQSQLSPTEYELAWQAGKRLTIDEAITLVNELGG